jgi:hypothetical protein
MNNPKYVIDSSSLSEIQDGPSGSLPPSVFPGILDALDQLVSKKLLISIDLVYLELQEIIDNENPVKIWVSNNQGIFLPTHSEIQLLGRQLINKYLEPNTLMKNKNGADPFIVAAAKYFNCRVVTQEKPKRPANDPNCKKYSIADLCIIEKIPHYRLVDMLKEEQYRLTL